MATVDDVKLDAETLEWAAREIEEGSILDLRGISDPRKRGREDAELRRATREEQRRELAKHLRAFKNRPDLEPTSILAGIVVASEKGARMDRYLRDAWPLAWKKLLKIECIVDCTSNSIPPGIEYRITITDAGRRALEAQEPKP